MGKPCAVFWNIDNIDVPKGQSVDSVVGLIRSTIIQPYNLNEIFFFCVCDAHKLPSNVDHSLTNLDFQTYNGIKDSADNKMLELMRKFVKVAGQDCTIIFLGCDGDYYGTLSDLKKLHNISIHLIGLADLYSPKLDEISDYIFMLNDDVLELVKSTDEPMYFISVTNYSVNNIKQVMTDLNNLYIGNSGILYDCSICIGFCTLFNAEKAIKQLNGAGYYDTILKAELLLDSPLTGILKCIKPNVDMQTKDNNEVKQLTFIKMNISNEADDSKIIKFCIACSEQSGSQCILSMKSYLWIVFSYESDGQKFLPKVKIIYPDAVISEPPIDLTLTLDENTYSVESCDVIDTNREPSSVATLHACDDIDWNIFFRFNCDFIAPMPYYEPTKWSLLYNLFEKLYDYGAKKVIFDGNVYCAHFDSASVYQDALAQMRSLYLEPLEYVLVPETQKLKAAKKMTRYPGIPWCLNEQLDLSCLVIKIESQLHNHFVDIGKNILGNRECIFIKSISGEIWIGFPDEHLCKNSEKRVKGFLASLKQKNDVSIAKPSNELLESINFRDLAGDAYDLAFLSSQLEGSKSIKRPNIIERIRLQRMQEQECNESVFHFTVSGQFYSSNSFPGLALEKAVKMVVKFSKVIPLAATAAYEKVNLIYNSWHEAHTALHFIKKLTAAEVPYFREFGGTSNVQHQSFAYCSYSEYYIINDKRKVLEKIVQNKNQVEKLDSNSSSFQSIVKQLQYLYIIKTNSDFDFTSGMISIIKLNLIQMDCPVCIEFEDEIWVAVDDLEKGKKAKARIDQIKFKMLHEKDDDFDVRVVMESTHRSPTKVASMLADKFMNPKKNARNIFLNSDPFPLGHFNYSYRKAVGMSTSRYCQLNV